MKKVSTAEGNAYTAFCSAFNLEPAWLGKTFKDEKGRSYTITGLNIRSRMFPVLTKQGTSLRAEYIRALMTNSLEAYKNEQKDKWNEQRRRELRDARQTYVTHGSSYGLKKQWLYKSFVNGGHTYTPIGLEFGGTKTKVLTRRDDGQVRWFSPPSYFIERIIGKKAA